jgi:hypothetical protein
MAFTLLEAAKYGDDVKRAGVLKLITETSPMYEKLTFKSIKGNAYRYNIEQALPDVAFRGVGDTYTASTGVINPVVETLTILGGEVKLDNFIVNTMGNIQEVKAAQYAMKSRAMGFKFSESFFEGDSATDINQFDGIRKRLVGDQKVLNASGGGALTLDKMDEMLDRVIGTPDYIFINRTLRRKLTKLGRDAGTASGAPLIDYGSDDRFGHQVERYRGIPLVIMENELDGSTILDFDEDPGDGASDTASIYAVRFGEDFIHGITGEGGSFMDVRDFGEMESAPQHLGRIEWYVGLCVVHPRSAARLYGITNA